VDVATLTMTSIPFPLQEALRDSITSGTFVDTKIWLFSKRTSKPGRVGEPKPLFVNGHEPASPRQVMTKKPRNSSDIDLEDSDAKNNESSDIISVSDLDSLFSESSDTKGETETASSVHVGKVVVIEDVAFVT